MPILNSQRKVPVPLRRLFAQHPQTPMRTIANGHILKMVPPLVLTAIPPPLKSPKEAALN